MASWNDDRLELALRASREGIWDWDLVEKTIHYSARVLRFLGYKRDEVPHFFEERAEHMDADSVAAVDEALRRVCQEGEDLFAVEPQVRTKKGEWKWFRVRGTPVRDELGKVIRIAGSLIDISKRKAAEKELAEERALIQTLMDNIPMNVYFKDTASRFVMANLPTAQKMGLETPEQLLDKSDYDFFLAEHAEKTRELERQIMETRRGLADLTEHEKWDDRPDTWVKSTKHPWVGSDGEVKGIFGVTSDVSELMRAREEQEQTAAELHVRNSKIEEERQRMRLIIDSVPMNVYFKNRDHQFVIANHSIARWFGCEKPEELYEKSDRDFFSEEHARIAEEDENGIMETGVPMVGRVERETWSGKNDTWVMTSKYPWRDSEGDIVGTFGVSSDVSELMLAQRDLTDVAERLQEKNQEMAEELSLAREVQLSLIPEEIPEISDGKRTIKFSKLYQSARDLAGDFFEVIPLAEGRVGFLMCDVAGQGVRSALIVSMLRGLIEKQAESAGDAGGFLTGLNEGLDHLLVESGVGIRASAFYGVVDLAKDEIQISVAGHPNPVTVFSDGTRQLVPPDFARGPALGENSGEKYQAVVAPLKGVRRMICFTDGVRRATNAMGEEFGVGRMLEVIERGGPMERVLDQLARNVVEFAGGDDFKEAVCLLGWEVVK